MWRHAMNEKDMTEEDLARDWGTIVAFANERLAAPEPKQHVPFQSFEDPHVHWPQLIPAAKHLYLNKLWCCRHKCVSAA